MQDPDPHVWRHPDALWLHPKLQEDACHPGGWGFWHIVSTACHMIFKL